MTVYNSLAEYPKTEYGTAVALGFFDGVHLGHKAVLSSAVGAFHSIALTFADSPAKNLGRTAPPRLTDNRKKAELIGCLGVDDVIFADFSEIMNLSPEEFVAEILVNRLNAKKVCCGFNYHFGKNGSGDTATLAQLCADFGIDFIACAPVECDGEQVSSSLIRRLICDGEIERANRMLGYHFAIQGEIKSGNHIGSTLGFPTVNIPIKDGDIVPRFGVYASAVSVDGVVYRGAMNIGVHPTVGSNATPLCEVFLLDFEGGDLYGESAKCELVSFVRPERHFASLDELTAEIERNCDFIKAMNFE